MSEGKEPERGRGQLPSDRDDDPLDAAFAAARATAPAVAPLSSDLSARLIADALEAMPVQSVSPRRADHVRRFGILSWLRFGVSWPAASGLAACAALGVWVGAAPPDFVDAVSGSLLSELGLEDPLAAIRVDNLSDAFDLASFDE
ncbi:MAG: hypothetical protein AAF646_06175 [Pseudomonadota bacterium]